MTEFIVLRVSEHTADSVDWITVDQTGVCRSEPESDDLATIVKAAAGKKVIGLVPARSVLRTDTDIPVRSTSKLLQALPFAMEEQLAEDVDQLHFAIGSRRPGSRLPVAVVQRSKMEAWRERFAQAGISPVGLYSEGDALGDIPGTTILLIESDQVMLRTPDGSLATADRGGLDTLIDLWMAARKPSNDDKATEPVNLLIYTTADAQQDLDSFIGHIQPLVDTLDVKLLSDGTLPRMASQITVNPGVNLLQGEYAPRSNFAAYWPAWRVAAILLLGLIGTASAVKVVEIVRLDRQIEALDGAIEQAFRYTFPGTGEIRDARALFDSKLRELGSNVSASSQSDFLDTLEAIAAAVSQSTDDQSKLEAINYRSGVTELRVLAPNVESLDTLQKAIVKHGGLSAEIQSANPQGDKVLGRLQIKSPGA